MTIGLAGLNHGLIQWSKTGLGDRAVLASLLVGFSAERLGVMTAVLINSVLLMAIPVLMWALRPELRQWVVACEADKSKVCV